MCVCHGDDGVGPLAIGLPVGQLLCPMCVCHGDDGVGPLAIRLPVGQLLCVMRTMRLVP